MKITEIKRTVSDGNYNNMTATATIGEDENIIEAAVELDRKIKKMMAEIINEAAEIEDYRRQKAEAVDILKDALNHATNCRIPF